MSYYKELKDRILSLKEVFFLSPREVWFLKFLEEKGYPLEVVREGIERYYLSIPPKRRDKMPLFFAFREIQKLYERELERQARNIKLDWQRRYLQKLESVKEFIEEKELPKDLPKDEREAEEILKDVENLIAKRLWDALPREEKVKLYKKYSQFKEDQELFKLMIKHELFKVKGLKPLSLYID